VWEVDLPENIDGKRKRLKKILGDIPAHVTLVPVDFDRERIGDVLAAHGYSPELRTFFIWEAVTQYLPAPSIESTFDFLANAPSGSRLAFTYIRRDFIEGKSRYGQEQLYRNMIVKNKTWLFGINPDEVADFIAPSGWRVLEHYGYDELADKYVKPTGRILLSTPLERMVYAEKDGATSN
jgi:methyltransferase (TIGR00027 family)